MVILGQAKGLAASEADRLVCRRDLGQGLARAGTTSGDTMIHDLAPESTYRARNILRLLRPHDLLGAQKLRLGRFFDGGYVMIDKFENVRAAYSLGINDDVSWDLDIANRGIPVFQYDHTIAALPAAHPLFTWSKTGISHVPDIENALDTLANLIERNGHSDETDMLLKCDIEGFEWMALASVPGAVLNQFSQIVIELHALGDLYLPASAEIARQALLNLTANHKVVHVHANNFAPWSIVGGIPVPSVIELTLMRIDQGSFVISDRTFPTELDMPCHSREADFYLGRFDY